LEAQDSPREVCWQNIATLHQSFSQQLSYYRSSGFSRDKASSPSRSIHRLAIVKVEYLPIAGFIILTTVVGTFIDKKIYSFSGFAAKVTAKLGSL
jgi:hypothetical protein